jgi:coenzyme F420-reducing hydrogenase delta subunit
LTDHDDVLVLVCPDEACRHLEGNKRALKSVERAKSLLRAVGGDENRIHVQQISHAMPQALREQLAEL